MVLFWVPILLWGINLGDPKRDHDFDNPPIDQGSCIGEHVGDCQNYGPFEGPYYNTGPNTRPNFRGPKKGP